MSAPIVVASIRKCCAFRARPIAAGIALALALSGASTLTHAHTASVNTVAQLKAAILTASTDSSDDVITLTSNITFASAADAISIFVRDERTLTIAGGGFTLSGANLARVLNITSGKVVIENLTITKGTLSGDGGTGGETSNGGTVLGAGIFNSGTLTIRNVNVTQNTATGGGGGGSAGGGGGGSGANGVGGGDGGSLRIGVPTQTAVGAVGNFGNGGTGAGYGGRGGTSAGGGAGGNNGYSGSSGGTGGTVTAGITTIGGGGGGTPTTTIGGGGGTPTRGGIGTYGGDAVGAIFNTGYLSVAGASTISNNLAAGGGGGRGGFGVGGIYNTGRLSITGSSTISNNSGAGGSGNPWPGTGGRGVGAIWNRSGTLKIPAENVLMMVGNVGVSGASVAVPQYFPPQGVNNIFDDTGTVNTDLALNRYRIYVPSTGGYLYTTDSNEYQALIKLTGTYIDDGIDHKILSQAFTLSGITAVPYYRLYIKPIRQHFWTTDVNEYNVQRAKTAEFGDDGIDGYIFPTAGVLGSIPLYRLSIKGTAIHYWTTNKNEFDTLVATRVGIGEGAIGNPPGVTGYVLPK